MKQKFLLFIIAAFMATTSAWAGIDDDLQQYLTNIQYEKTTGALTFNDVFQNSISMPRWYIVEAYIQEEGNAIYQDGLKGYFYGNPSTDQITSDLRHRSCFIAAVEYERYGYNTHSGGQQRLYITELLTKCYQAGYYKIHIAIRPQYSETISHNTKEYGSYQGTGCWLKNSIDLNLPVIAKYTLSVPTKIKYGETLYIYGTIQAANKCNYYIQESQDGGVSWRNIQSGSLTAAQAREVTKVTYKRVVLDKGIKNLQFRMKVSAYEAPYGWIHNETSEIQTTSLIYSCSLNGDVVDRKADETFYTDKAADCAEYKVISDLPVTKTIEGDLIKWTMPACNLSINEVVTTYTVKFLNADYTLLKTVEVECGADATSEAPANPTYSTYTFTGWSQDLTNIHKNMSVVAKYDIGNTYWFDAYLNDHENSVFPVTGFDKSETRVMVGDKLTFTADVFAATNATIYYETAFWDNNAQDYDWPTKQNRIKVAAYTTPNKEQFFNQTIQVAYTPNNSYINPFQRKMAVRFIMFIADQTIYSDPWEIDIYYPLTINAPEMDALFVENTAGDFNMGEQNIFIPARYNDTIRLYSINGADGGCMDYARVLYPSRSLDSGIDENGNAYIIAPGEQETINTSVSEKLVVFDGVASPKTMDFTAQGFGKINGYYAEVVPCGGSVTMPEDPTEDNYIFLGWQAWNDEYADDAYLHVPAVNDNIIGFTAKFEYLPEVPTYTVRFYGKDGSPLLDTQSVNEGENATPPVAPEVSGYHFVGWDKPYTTITANTDITALYGEDTKVWTVTYKNWDGTNLGTEQVNDGEAAQCVIIATREGYTFVKWRDSFSGDDVDFAHITANITVEAVFTEILYTVTYRVEGVVTYTIQAVAGHPASNIYYPHGTPTKQPTEAIAYTFTGWTPEVTTINEDVTFDAVFAESPRKYTVIFQNWDHTLLEEQQVAYGTAATAPADPVRDGYTFTGWDREFNNILADMTVTALFEKNKDIQTSLDEIVGDMYGNDDENGNGKLSNRKFIHEGTLYILLPDGKLYNAQGQEVK